MDAEASERNIRAHKDLDRLGFPHKTINHIVIDRIADYLSDHNGGAGEPFRILDVGCGTGYLLGKLLARGWDAQGVDPFPRGTALREPLRSHVTVGTIDTVDGTGFNVITAVEVLEHTENYMTLLRDMIRLLHSGGLLLVTVPNNWEFHVITGSGGSVEPGYGHLWQFRREDLEKDLNGFPGEVSVNQIYSRNLDRRLLRITRMIPSRTVLRLSSRLVDRLHDGAWLLGSFIKSEGNVDLEEHELAKHSAVYYQDVPPSSKP